MLIGMPLETTIKVSKDLRERIATAARAESATINDFLGGLMAEYERSRRLAAAAHAMRSASPEVMEEYLREFREWDVTNADGLDGL
jgi:predicted transcriptional regulator